MRHSKSVLLPFALAVAIAIVSPARAGAQDVTLILENDPGLGNPRPDDLYTSSFAVEAPLAGGRMTLGERMFTDRERGVRFDETHLAWTAPAVRVGAWDARASAGVLRVGRGFIGETGQNLFHDWIGNDRVELEYIEGTSSFATATIQAARPLGRIGSASVSTNLELFAAPGFRQWSRVEIAAEKPLGRALTVGAGIGGRVDAAEGSYFADRIPKAGATAALAVGWRSMSLRWTWNGHGTQSPNVSLTYRPWGAR